MRQQTNRGQARLAGHQVLGTHDAVPGGDEGTEPVLGDLGVGDGAGDLAAEAVDLDLPGHDLDGDGVLGRARPAAAGLRGCPGRGEADLVAGLLALVAEGHVGHVSRRALPRGTHGDAQARGLVGRHRERHRSVLRPSSASRRPRSRRIELRGGSSRRRPSQPSQDGIAGSSVGWWVRHPHVAGAKDREADRVRAAAASIEIVFMSRGMRRVEVWLPVTTDPVSRFSDVVLRVRPMSQSPNRATRLKAASAGLAVAALAATGLALSSTSTEAATPTASSLKPGYAGAPVNPAPYSVTQPDGSTLQVHRFGDALSNGVATVAGRLHRREGQRRLLALRLRPQRPPARSRRPPWSPARALLRRPPRAWRPPRLAGRPRT